MLGSFNQEALAAYAEAVASTVPKKTKKRLPNVQGCESLDNMGIGAHDKSYLEKKSTLKEDYSAYDYTECLVSTPF